MIPGPRSRLLAAESLSVRYLTRKALALRQVSFGVEAGERVLLAGPSGSGKSTLALCLSGLIPNSIDADLEGSVWVDNQRTVDAAPGALAEQVGMVFQDPGTQFTMLTVADEVAFGLENLGVNPAEMPARVHGALRAVNLQDRSEWRLDRLSGGQQQRVALAAALAMQPRTLVLDEPSAHLDPLGAADLYQEIQFVADRTETALVVVEHDLDKVVPHLARRTVMLDREGRLAADGPSHEIFGQSVNAARWQAAGVWLPVPATLALRLDPSASSLPLDETEFAAWLAMRPAAAHQLQASSSSPASSPEPGEVLLEARDLWHRYATPTGTFQALRGINLRVRAGEMVALIGPNGSGKSTLIRALTGLAKLERGQVQVVGKDPHRLHPRQIAPLVSLVFQNPEAAFVADTVLDEVAYGPRALGWSESKVQAHVSDVLEKLGLESLARANPFTLSQGQKRRLSVAVALVHGPRLLLLDEPTFGQDRRSADVLMAEIGRLRREGIGVVVATHDLGLVAEHADRVVGLADGQALYDGPLASLATDPALLRRLRQQAPPLWRALARARAAGLDVPAHLRWQDIP